MRLDPINLYDYEARAKQVLPHNSWDFIDAGAMDEVTTGRNRTAFEALSLRPRFLRDVRNRDISTTVMGDKISLPVLLAPSGMHMLAHPEGELAAAKGAGMSGTILMMSTASNYNLEEVAAVATTPLWFQLYHRGYDLTENLVHRAEEAGYTVLCLTVDTPVPSPKERDIRNRFARVGEMANFRDTGEVRADFGGSARPTQWEAPRGNDLTWKELEWLRSLSSMPLVLKGIR
ncbi:MAG: alpha-hydroxy acid oxidase, partial [Dehalococcoidia bacterium]|nr:alpha-hydroxy acid oxidase [Dehalococcoidia bacterium]